MQPPKPIVWEVTPREAQIILGALAELPFKHVGNLIPRLLASSNAQLAPPPAPPGEEGPGEGMTVQ